MKVQIDLLITVKNVVAGSYDGMPASDPKCYDLAEVLHRNKVFPLLIVNRLVCRSL